MNGLKVSQYEYCKIILEKMAFDRKLFLKEYRKSLGTLSADEGNKIKTWARERFRK